MPVVVTTPATLGPTPLATLELATTVQMLDALATRAHVDLTDLVADRAPEDLFPKLGAQDAVDAAIGWGWLRGVSQCYGESVEWLLRSAGRGPAL